MIDNRGRRVPWTRVGGVSRGDIGPCKASSEATVSRIKRSRTGSAWLLPITSCDNCLYEMLLGRAFGAPSTTART